MLPLFLHRRSRCLFWDTNNTLNEAQFRMSFRRHRKFFQTSPRLCATENHSKFNYRFIVKRTNRARGARGRRITNADQRFALRPNIVTENRDSTMCDIFKDTADVFTSDLYFLRFPNAVDKCVDLGKGFSSSLRARNPLAVCF